MRIKTSVALDLETLMLMGKLVREGQFRNKSHVMEFAIKRLIQEHK